MLHRKHGENDFDSKPWQLLAVLSNGLPQHISVLGQLVGVSPQQVNVLWRKMPHHIRGLLRQHSGWWRLVRPLAVFDRTHLQQIGAKYGFRTVLHHECTSSNDIVLKAVKASPEQADGLLVVTHAQNQGRGRQGRVWQSRLGECLMFSFSSVFEQLQHELGALTLAVALACHAVLTRFGLPVQIKWPNDLVSGENKLGGILVETVRSGGKTVAVVGIGINFVLPEGVLNATSVQTLLPAALSPGVNAAELLGALLAELNDVVLNQYRSYGFAPLLNAYQKANRDLNRKVCLLQNGITVYEGVVAGITEHGALRLRNGEKEHIVVTGEISLRSNNKPQPLTVAAVKKYLLLDGGNSQLKWAWVENGYIVGRGRCSYNHLQQLGTEWAGRMTDKVRVIGCAVCGEIKKSQVAAQLSQPVEWLASMPQALGIRNHYRNVAEHGADRWFNVLGSRCFTQNACVVVSCGTAVTVDVLTDDNHYLGGTIMPGFRLMKEAVANKTAKLNVQTGSIYPFPTTTANALASGMMDAVCGSVLLMHTRLKDRVGGKKPVDLIVTGGGALKVVQALPPLFALDNAVKIVDNLVIHGLLNWIEKQ